MINETSYEPHTTNLFRKCDDKRSDAKNNNLTCLKYHDTTTQQFQNHIRFTRK